MLENLFIALIAVRHTAWLLLLVTAAGLLLATSYLLAVRAFTRVIMHATLILRYSSVILYLKLQ